MIALGYLDVIALNFIWLLCEPRLKCDVCPPNTLETFPNRNGAAGGRRGTAGHLISPR